jgi:endonuclease-8
MPEGDTVFITARQLREGLAGKTISRFDLRVPSLALADATGETVMSVASVGKHLLIRLSGGRTLHSHLRMDGAWRVYGAHERPRGGPEHAIRAIVASADSAAYGYRVHDLALIRTADESEIIGHLGPDLLADPFDLEEALRRFAARGDLTVGEALLDQRLVAGIGNVYKSELLFVHRLSPWSRVDTVLDSLPSLLTDAARWLRANTVGFNRTTTGWTQRGQQHYVYGRERQGCRRCGTAICKAEQGPAAEERVLYFCPACQDVTDITGS